jgi:hypothetical protein
MRTNARNSNYLLLKTLALSILVVLMLFLWQGNKGFSLWDEGFLWYGAQRVMVGEVPIRDFMAYDPGRYYWSAALMSIFGSNSIMSLRSAVAIFQAIGLFVGLLLIAHSAKSHSKGNGFYLLLSAASLAIWMFPRHKLFDISLSILLIGILTFLIKAPSIKRYFFAGVCLGLVATFGRNHGVYGLAGSLGVMLWLNINGFEGPIFLKKFIAWVTGILVGFSPIFLMATLIPGFAISFWESILFLFEIRSTNLPLPVPWPWNVNFNSVSLGQGIREVLIGLFFIGIVTFGILSVLWVLLQRSRKKPVSPALVAASFLTIPYAHYAYSRADIGHLAQGIFPFLVGTLVLLAAMPSKIKWILGSSLAAASFWVMHVFHPGWQCYSTKQCISVEVHDSNLQIDPGTASDIALLNQLAEEHSPEGQSFIAVPFWPGAYALLERRSPMWEIYALFPRSKTFEQKEIERIREANPGFAIIYDIPLDGREELRFRNTHPLTYQYILENFEPLPNSPNPAYQIYKARDL